MVDSTLRLDIDARGAQQGAQQFSRSADDIKRKASRTSQAVDKARGAFDRLKQSVFSLKGALGALGGALAVRQLAQFGQQALDTAGNIADVSKQVGLSAERLQGLREAFEQNALSAQKADEALIKFQRRIGLAANEEGAAAKSVERFNIALEDSSGQARATGNVLNDVIDVISSLESSSERAGVASQFFGERVGPQIAPLLAQGSEAVNAYTERLKDLGLAFSDDVVNAASEASTSLSRLRGDLTRAFQTGLLESFLGKTNNIEQALADLRPQAREFGKTIGEGLSAAAEAADDIQRFFQFLVDNQETIIRVFGALAGARVGGGLGGAFGPTVGRAGAISGGVLGAFTPELFGGEGGNQALDALRQQREEVARLANEGLPNLQDRYDRLKDTIIPVLEVSASLNDAQQLLVSQGFNKQAAQAFLSRFENLESALKRSRNEVQLTKRAIDQISGQPSPSSSGPSPTPTGNGGGGGDAPVVPSGFPGPDAVTRTNDLIANQREELDRLGQTLRDDINPAWTQYRDRIQNLNTALDAGRINQREFNELAQQAGRSLNEQAEQGTEGLNRMQKAADQLGFSFSSAFEDAIIGGKEFSSVLQGLAQDIARIAIRQTVTKPLAGAFSSFIGDALGGILSGGGATTGAAVPSAQGGVGDPATRLPGAADGGSFTVGGAFPSINAGRDNRLVQFAARDGERVNVTPMGGNSGGNGDVTVQVVNNGQPLQVESTQKTVQPDGRTVIRAQVRNMMKEEINSGGLDREMAGNFGVQRQGRR